MLLSQKLVHSKMPINKKNFVFDLKHLTRVFDPFVGLVLLQAEPDKSIEDT